MVLPDPNPPAPFQESFPLGQGCYNPLAHEPHTWHFPGFPDQLLECEGHKRCGAPHVFEIEGTPNLARCQLDTGHPAEVLHWDEIWGTWTSPPR